MRPILSQLLRFAIAALLLLILMLSPVASPAQSKEGNASEPQDTAQKLYTFRSQTDLVLVNVVARDRHGNLLRGLQASDFTVLEDGRPQHIASFDVEDVDIAPWARLKRS